MREKLVLVRESVAADSFLLPENSGSAPRQDDAGRRTGSPAIVNGGAERSTDDLLPANRASRSLVKFVFGEEDKHEEALYGTANHRVSEGSRDGMPAKEL